VPKGCRKKIESSEAVGLNLREAKERERKEGGNERGG